MEISGRSVVSSGVYERFFVLDGRTYHHILNPKTGYPYDNGLISVTIISEKSVDGDGLSTSCFALGLEKGLQLIESLPNTYAVFITDDYNLHYSSGFEKAIHVLP
jgi:thiamine biosynthesis lipoprotein